MKQTGTKLISNNKKAFHEYFILETVECGIVLVGTEVKSLRQGNCSLKESFVKIRYGEVFLYGMHISPYEKGNIFNRDPLRVRKLLLHRKEIAKLQTKVEEKGVTLIPLEIYFLDGRVKVKLAVAKGKKLYDKRESIAAKTADREMERAYKGQYRA
ncbi:MAG: SsrA-binding protein SmpB [Lachnospiraceae bacterium]|nr:SsrA-binding protein SmpB [Lachnospiraceae bacterium]